MKEIRLTVSTEDFAAASRALLGVGIGFRVEPVDEPPPEKSPPEAPPVLKRRAAKKAAKPSGKPASDEIPLTGADRLRSALARRPSELAPASSPPEAADTVRSPSGDNRI